MSLCALAFQLVSNPAETLSSHFNGFEGISEVAAPLDPEMWGFALSDEEREGLKLSAPGQVPIHSLTSITHWSVSHLHQISSEAHYTSSAEHNVISFTHYTNSTTHSPESYYHSEASVIHDGQSRFHKEDSTWTPKIPWPFPFFSAELPQTSISDAPVNE